MQIHVQLLEWQQEVFHKEKRFTVIAAGRQCGKTQYCVFRIIIASLCSPDQICWWVAPTYSPTKIAFRRCIKFLQKNNINFHKNRSELTITFDNGSQIFFKSADREEGLRGETLNFLIIDEIGLLKRDAWEYAIRGAITVNQANVIFIGTPKGKNLFYEIFLLGMDKLESEYISFQFESRISHFFPDKEWETVKKLPERVFLQEYCAQFIDDGGEVFRNIKNCIKGNFEKKHSNKTYYAGIDIAKTTDYTVICILDENGHLVAFDRFNQISWTIQKKRIITLIKEYDAITLIDSTGIGDPILDDLLLHIKIEGFKFTNISKRQLIETLSIALEKEEISFPEIPELINELSIFSFEQTESGLIKYSAPSGLHDDIVFSLALANWAYKRNHGGIENFSDIGERISQDF